MSCLVSDMWRRRGLYNIVNKARVIEVDFACEWQPFHLKISQSFLIIAIKLYL